MGNYTREEILQMVEEEDVEFIRLQFTDMFGAIKNIAVTARELPRALNNQCIINAEQIAGMDPEKGSDLYLRPIPDTFAILPWRPQQGKVARMICDLYCPDGTPYKNSPRYILERVAKEAEQEGYTCYIDPECEFFLFHTDDNGMPTTVTHEKAGYLDMSPLDLGENARRDMVLTLEDMGMEVESSHHEAAPAQHEIDFSYGEVRDIADCIMTFKMAVRIVAKRHGLHATFMPKPKTEANGSGMHIQFSLIKNGENVFECADRPGELSEDAYYFIGGLLAHSKEMALITNPLVNSYKRLVPGYDAPTELTWTENNQNSLVRIPVTRGEGIRVELRSPDASANPYVVLAVCLAAGLDGIKNKITPTKSSNLAAQDQQAEHLPETLKEAIDYFESSSWVKEVLGEEFCRQYVAAKKNEWLRYTRQVTDWEIAEYLYRL
ncbi:MULTISPECIES: type I glutamate--ammonia ligase [unclassified Blautia]|uniref:type I glutamate--ammonia ligase n=1 Tax=unclassified Blautia TaxID=2648079 RepID=UPI000930045F|nr:type I glutamate--ammonia ligase [Blautia sp. Marseille-P3087]